MTPRIIRLVAEIDEFKGYWRGLQVLSPDRLATLRILATIESIGSSTRIEGSKLTDREVSALMEGLDFASFRNRDEQEVAGYAKVMAQIHESYEQIALAVNSVKYLHKALLQFSAKDQWHSGEYKKHPNHVATRDAGGKQIGIIFETATPFDTPQLMVGVLERTQKLLEDNDTHLLLTVADFVIRFLAIHPFQDGNGRLSRILTNLLLLRSGYDFALYSSHERIIEANKDHYYKALRSSQQDILEKESMDDSWAEFFLDLLVKQKDELDGKIQRERRILEIPPLSVRILDLIRQHGRMSVAPLSNLLEANRNTVKKHLQALVRQNRLSQKGRGRGTYYTLR